MRAYPTALVLETGRAMAATGIVHVERTERAAMFKNMALFLLAPFIGLVYAVLLPFVGLGMLAFFGARAFHRTGKAHRVLGTGKKMVLCAVAPVAGLAYVVALPFAGFAALIWLGARAALVATPA